MSFIANILRQFHTCRDKDRQRERPTRPSGPWNLRIAQKKFDQNRCEFCASVVKKRIGESKRDGPFPRRRVPCYSLLAIASAALLLESVQPGRVVYQDLAQQRH